jgi:hypothetical protein
VVLRREGLRVTARRVGYVSKNSKSQCINDWNEANDLSGNIGNIFQEAASDGISEEPDTGEAEG